MVMEAGVAQLHPRRVILWVTSRLALKFVQVLAAPHIKGSSRPTGDLLNRIRQNGALITAQGCQHFH